MSENTIKTEAIPTDTKMTDAEKEAVKFMIKHIAKRVALFGAITITTAAVTHIVTKKLAEAEVLPELTTD